MTRLPACPPLGPPVHVARLPPASLSILRQVRKFRVHWKSESSNLIQRDPAGTDDGRALFIRNEKELGLAAVPDGVDRDGIRDNDNTFAGSVRSRDLLEQVWVWWKCRNHHVGLKTFEPAGEMVFEPRKTSEIFVEIILSIQPSVDVAPGARPAVDQS